MKRGSVGYIAIDRRIFERPMFRRRPERLVAWEWLIAAAAWKPEGKRFEFGAVHLERGQLATTRRALGISWGWPKSKVDRFLERLARDGMITLQTGPRTGPRTGPQCTLLTICNYDKFQNRGKKPGHEPGHEPGHDAQQVLPIAELLPPQPTNQETIAKAGVDNSGEKGQASKGEGGQRSRTKPRHGAKGRGMIWLDHGTSEWDLYAADFKEKRGADKLPESRVGGRGNWFVLLGEPERAAGRRSAAGGR